MVGSWVEFAFRNRQDRWVWSAARIAGLAMDARGQWSAILVTFGGQFRVETDILSLRVITDVEVAKYRRNAKARARRRKKLRDED